jgi:hypothetical protein
MSALWDAVFTQVLEPTGPLMLSPSGTPYTYVTFVAGVSLPGQMAFLRQSGNDIAPKITSSEFGSWGKCGNHRETEQGPKYRNNGFQWT